jgi:hypothetical protein
MRRSFSSDELALLTRVVDKACLDIGGCDTLTHDEIASRLLAYYADYGERDFEKLLSVATAIRVRRVAHAG